ncbi:MAG: hypothetical protein MJE77_44645 [Proteobacteria bacterium]|nr:hypothetical protein [Pseudomonadota bacterium]
MADRVPHHNLTREVLPPQKQPSGFGVVVVAALAMFMAVASSAMVLRARMAKSSCWASPSRVVVPRTPVGDIAVPPESPRQCGTPVSRHNPDGSTTVYFDVCPHDTATPWGIRSADPAVIEVGDIRARLQLLE